MGKDDVKDNEDDDDDSDMSRLLFDVTRPCRSTISNDMEDNAHSMASMESLDIESLYDRELNSYLSGADPMHVRSKSMVSMKQMPMEMEQIDVPGMLIPKPQSMHQMEQQMSKLLELFQASSKVQKTFQEQMSKHMEHINEKLTFIEGHLPEKPMKDLKHVQKKKPTLMNKMQRHMWKKLMQTTPTKLRKGFS